MRITGGRARGVPLLVPKGRATRPATDRMREAVFSSLAGTVEGAVVVDLFAGTGAYGLEAWSRGASETTFIENHRRTAALLEENLERVARSLGAVNPLPARVICGDALAPALSPGAADIVFADPPYETLPATVHRIFARAADWLKPDGGLLAIEAPGEISLGAPGWSLVRQLGKGRHEPTMTIFRQAFS